MVSVYSIWPYGLSLFHLPAKHPFLNLQADIRNGIIREAGGGEVGGDNRTELLDNNTTTIATTTRQPGPVDPPLLEESTAKGGMRQADSKGRDISENEQCRAKWDRQHRQHKPPPSATGNAAYSIREPKLLFVRPKSRLESPLRRSRKRVKIAYSHPKRRSLSPIPLEQPAVTKIRLLPGRREGNNGLCGKAAPQKLTQITLRQLPSGESFLAAVIQDDRNVASFAYNQSMILINRTLGDTRQVDSIVITLLTLNPWLLTGHLRPYSDVVRSDLNGMATKQASGFSSGLGTDSDIYLESDTHILRSKTPDTRVIPLIDSECSSVDDGGSTKNDTSLDHNGSYAGEEDKTNGPKPIMSRRRRPWERSEDLLRECVKQNEPWDKIGKQLDRSASAVCQH